MSKSFGCNCNSCSTSRRCMLALWKVWCSRSNCSHLFDNILFVSLEVFKKEGTYVGIPSFQESALHGSLPNNLGHFLGDLTISIFCVSKNIFFYDNYSFLWGEKCSSIHSYAWDQIAASALLVSMVAPPFLTTMIRHRRLVDPMGKLHTYHLTPSLTSSRVPLTGLS